MKRLEILTRKAQKVAEKENGGNEYWVLKVGNVLFLRNF